MIRRLAAVTTGLGPARSQPVVLMYHRIADADYDPFGLAVSPAQFETQLATLASTRNVLPLDDFARKLREGTLPRHAAAITFDDGYACNALVAAPRLRAYNLPATFFLTTGAIGERREFWWDELGRLLIETDFPGGTSLTIAGFTFRFERELRHVPRETLRNWTWSKPSDEPRLTLYQKIWARMIAASHAEQRAALTETWTALGIQPEARPSHRPMTQAEARTLAAEPLFHIAAHTESHLALANLSEAIQREEIANSLSACRSLSDRVATSFAYPYGSFGPVTKQIVTELGFQSACSTHASFARRGADPFAIPRLQVLAATALTRSGILRTLAGVQARVSG